MNTRAFFSLVALAVVSVNVLARDNWYKAASEVGLKKETVAQCLNTARQEYSDERNIGTAKVDNVFCTVSPAGSSVTIWSTDEKKHLNIEIGPEEKLSTRETRELSRVQSEISTVSLPEPTRQGYMNILIKHFRELRVRLRSSVKPSEHKANGSQAQES